jgi:hypothetical protein
MINRDRWNMHDRFFSLLGIIAILVSCNYLGFTQAVPALSKKDEERIAKVQKDLRKIGLGNTITVSRIDNRDFFGRVKTIGSSDFEIVETDSKQIQIFKYADIKNVREGDGTAAYADGKRRNRRTRWVVLAAGLAAIILIPVIALSGEGN